MLTNRFLLYRKYLYSDRHANFEIKKTKNLSKIPKTSSGRAKFVPEIRLCGKWLEDMGFDYGQRITVRLEGDRLVIQSDLGLRKNSQLEIWGDDLTA